MPCCELEADKDVCLDLCVLLERCITTLDVGILLLGGCSVCGTVCMAVLNIESVRCWNVVS